MKKQAHKSIIIILMAFAILLATKGTSMTLKRSIGLTSEYSVEKQTTYTYMSSLGSLYTSVAGGADSDMIYELLLAISNKYGEAAATTYCQCMALGDYTAYYNLIGGVKPSYKEGFVYSTNGNKQEMCGPQILEQALINTGLTNINDLLQAAMAAGYSNVDKYATAVKLGKVAKPTPSSTNTQAAAKQPETVVADAKSTEQKEQKEPEPKKEISHGIYEEISEEAENAFAELLSDGEDGSCYIQVKANAEDQIISAEAVSQTLKQKENGRVEFYNVAENEDDKAFVYSVTFPQIEVTEDIDLAATYAQNDTSKYENVYQFSFVDKQELPAEIEICVNVSGNARDKYYLLRGNDDTDYNVFATAECDDSGCVTYKTDTLDSIIVTTTDIISLRQAEEETLKKEQAEKEAAEKAEQEALAKANESSTQNAEEVETTEAFELTEKTVQNYTTYWAIGTAIMLGLAMVITGVVIYKKNH